jgi:hypothetical protein
LTIIVEEEALKLAKWWVGSFIIMLGLVIAYGQQGTPKGTPSWYQTEPVNMGDNINTKNREAEATFTADSKTMYYNCSTGLGQNDNNICVSYFVDDEWTVGVVVEGDAASPISTLGPSAAGPERYMEVEPYISLDGNKLQFMSNRPNIHGGPGIKNMDIWVSEKVDGVWQPAENLGTPINSIYGDHCLYYTGPDENTGYLTRMGAPDGYGDNDIYSVHRVNGVWQEPVNLGPNVNSASSDHHGMVSPDGRSIYFNSNRPRPWEGRTKTVWDEDIYVSTMDAKGVFGPAVPVTPLNSDYNDRCVTFTTNHRVVIFDSERPNGRGTTNKDLWWIYYENIKHIK